MAPAGLLDFARKIVPTPMRRWLRRAAREAPHRLRDLPRDAAALVAPRAFGGPMPSPGLRARVGFLGSREEFVLVGREGARQILEAIGRVDVERRNGDWLDFGCGCGRLARFLIESGAPRRYTGVDVDARQIAWAARHLDGRFGVMRLDPPLDFPDASFDVVIAVSVFTHFTEPEQFAWLADLRRILRPGGVLVTTTHAEALADAHPSVSEVGRRRLRERGFLFVPAERFNDRATFHRADYLTGAWSPLFTLRDFRPRGFVAYQDLAVWQAS